MDTSDETVVESLQRSFYIDHLGESVETEHEVLAITKHLIEMKRIGGFHLTKFQSDSKFVMGCFCLHRMLVNQ